MGTAATGDTRRATRQPSRTAGCRAQTSSLTHDPEIGTGTTAPPLSGDGGSQRVTALSAWRLKSARSHADRTSCDRSRGHDRLGRLPDRPPAPVAPTIDARGPHTRCCVHDNPRLLAAIATRNPISGARSAGDIVGTAGSDRRGEGGARPPRHISPMCPSPSRGRSERTARRCGRCCPDPHWTCA